MDDLIAERSLGFGIDFPATTSELVPLVYRRLVELAVTYLARIQPHLPISPNGLVHEVFLKLASRSDWHGLGHLLGVAAGEMREIIVDHLRRRAARKCGGGWRRHSLDGLALRARQPSDGFCVRELLEELASANSRAAQVVKFRYFDGLTIRQTATFMGISQGTVVNDWNTARAWLKVRVLQTGSFGFVTVQTD